MPPSAIVATADGGGHPLRRLTHSLGIAEDSWPHGGSLEEDKPAQPSAEAVFRKNIGHGQGSSYRAVDEQVCACAVGWGRGREYMGVNKGLGYLKLLSVEYQSLPGWSEVR